MTHLSLSLFGTFHARLDGSPLHGFRSDKARALLAYLTVDARPHSRTHLAGLLWPDWSETAARTYLRQALSNLRQILGDRSASTPFLLASRQIIQFNLQSDHWLDVAAVEQRLGQAAKTEREETFPERLACLEQAIKLYRDPFLENFYLDGCAAYEEWQVLVRERLQRQVVNALRLLANAYEAKGDYAVALDYARQQVDHSPWQEEGLRRLLRLMALIGERTQALAYYERYRQQVLSEFGVTPGPETVQLIEEIQRGAFLGTSATHSGQAANIELAQTGILQLPAFLDAIPPHGRRTPTFVARQQELSDLHAHLDRVLTGEGRVVFINGDAGSGKTSLLQEFARRAHHSHPRMLTVLGRCSAHTGTGDPYEAFCEVLRGMTGDIEAQWLAGTISSEQARRLWQEIPHILEVLFTDGPDLIPAFLRSDALLIQLSGNLPTDNLWVEQLRVRLQAKSRRAESTVHRQPDLFEQFTSVLKRLAHTHPLLILLDDLQWMDQGSISLLFHLGRQLAGAPILIVGTYRPEEIAGGRNGQRHPLSMLIHEFGRLWGNNIVDLSASNGAQFVDALVDSTPNRLDDGFRRALYQRSGGHALFVVELLHSLQSRGDLRQDASGRWLQTAILDWHTIPARVEATIAERIQRLPVDLQQILAVASIEGEQFTGEVVAHLLKIEVHALARLVSSELDRKHQLVTGHSVRWIAGGRLSVYRFRHILFQQYLYAQQDDTTRALLHEAVALRLQALYKGSLDEAAVHLAHHFQAAGVPAQAIFYFEEAAKRAIQFGALDEASAHITTALNLLESAPEAVFPAQQNRVQQEISLNLKLGLVLSMSKGHSSPEATAAYRRAYQLSQTIADTEQLFVGLWGLWRTYHVRAQLAIAFELSQQLLQLARATREEDFLVGAHQALVGTCYFTGRLQSAVDHAQECINRYRSDRHQEYRVLYGDDVGVVTLAHLALALFRLGYPEQANQEMQASLALARRLDHPVSLIFALSFGCHVLRLQGDLSAMRGQLERVVTLCTEHGIPQWLTMATMNLGWVEAAQGNVEQGIAQMQLGMERWADTGTFLGQAGAVIRLAEAHGFAHRPAEGLQLLESAQRGIEKTGEFLDYAELHRLKGELLWQQAQTKPHTTRADEIEACFQRAIVIAQEQEARLLELRATVSLSRLRIEQDKPEEALVQLAAIYGWFTEGFDSPDLVEAKALLDSGA